ncbi:MAG: hypothetical protein EPN94_05615 [Nitrospirae bacterium]|nr:MAG: hypothetical protein EPN94_05615 [Nitrospirota bacterium]
MKSSEDALKFFYLFKLADGSIKRFDISLDAKTLNYIPPDNQTPPEWAKLSYHKCSPCTLDETRHEFCPIASNIGDVVSAFKDSASYENAYVLVMTKARDISKNTTIQEGMSSLLGLYMVTSGCPVMEKLKPLVRYHLPFSSIEESVYRIVSMYLFAQYYLKSKGKKPDWELKKLSNIYENIRLVNAGMSERLKHAVAKDASVSAVTNLDDLASLVPILIKDTLASIEESFSSYLLE